MLTYTEALRVLVDEAPGHVRDNLEELEPSPAMTLLSRIYDRSVVLVADDLAELLEELGMAEGFDE